MGSSVGAAANSTAAFPSQFLRVKPQNVITLFNLLEWDLSLIDLEVVRRSYRLESSRLKNIKNPQITQITQISFEGSRSCRRGLDQTKRR
jgi:hypothetical protein